MGTDEQIFHRFPFHPRIRQRTTFPGKFQSQLTGEGLEFFDLREYTLGDDAKRIHWKHYAKSGELMIREDIMEANMRLWLAQDLSSSMNFGKKPILTKAFCAFLRHLLHEGGNALGIVAFTDIIIFFQKPSTNPLPSKAMSQLTRELIHPEKRKTSISAVCSFLTRQARSGDIIFMVSDFFSSENLQRALLPLSLRQELIPVVVRDSRETEFAGNSRISYKDMETGQTHTLLPGTDVRAHDTMLKKMFQKLSPEYLWLEGENFRDAIRVIAEWLYQRSKS